MANIAINCPGCQYELLIDELDAGQRIMCPRCGQLLVAVAEQPAVEQAKLVLCPQPPVAKKYCPSCQQQVAAEAVICVNCGTNLLTGQNISPLEAPAKTPGSPRGINRIIFSAIVVLVLLLGGLWWLHRKSPAENQAPAQATPVTGIETAYHTLTAHPPRSDADIVTTISGMKTLAAKAAALGLPDWKSRCEGYAFKMEGRRTTLAKEFHSLSNAVAALTAKQDFRAAAQLLQTYHGTFAVETEKYRAEQAAVLDRQAAQAGSQPPPPAPAATNTPPPLPAKEEEALNQEFLAAMYEGALLQFRVLLARDAGLLSAHRYEYVDAVLAIARSEEGWAKAVQLAQALNDLGAAEGTYSNLVTGLKAIHDRELQKAVIINRCAHMKVEAAQELRAVALPATAGGGTDQARAKAAVKLEAAKHKLEEADQLRQDAAAMPSLAAQLQELRDVLHGMAKSKPTGTAAAHPAAPPAVPAAKAEPMETVKFSLGGGVTMDFVLIRPGNFIMGSPFEHHAIPPRKVWITKRFCMGKYPVTQAQWQQVMGANPSQFKGAQNPVENVSWDDCQLFLVKLRERNPRIDFRLPTEAQREYACRAGTTTKYSFGDSDAVQEDYAWCHGNSGDKPHPVGGKKPNPWGLSDMHGNVLEWCADWYGGIYAADETVDPSGPSAGQDRVLRGGSWFNGVAHAGSANRDMRYPPATKSSNIGFRLVVIP